VAFTNDEMEFLRSHGIARLATSGDGAQPDVVPVACEFDGTYFWVGGSGQSVLSTRKVRNVRAGRCKVALVVDDLPSFDPFVPRGDPGLRRC
jgi:pyridoxamine 5'-phosphate oxidase family protein